MIDSIVPPDDTDARPGPTRSFAEAVASLPGFVAVGDPIQLVQRPRGRQRYVVQDTASPRPDGSSPP